jgi:hypothetical protein
MVAVSHPDTLGNVTHSFHARKAGTSHEEAFEFLMESVEAAFIALTTRPGIALSGQPRPTGGCNVSLGTSRLSDNSSGGRAGRTPWGEPVVQRLISNDRRQFPLTIEMVDGKAVQRRRPTPKGPIPVYATPKGRYRREDW